MTPLFDRNALRTRLREGPTEDSRGDATDLRVLAVDHKHFADDSVPQGIVLHRARADAFDSALEFFVHSLSRLEGTPVDASLEFHAVRARCLPLDRSLALQWLSRCTVDLQRALPLPAEETLEGGLLLVEHPEEIQLLLSYALELVTIYWSAGD